jgi:N-acetylglucosamine kinase-like BadF-type ATPase
LNTYLGFDGGGTKTECYALDFSGGVSGRGIAGPSNPLRVGYEAAIASIEAAGKEAMTAAQVTRADIRGICAGLAGAGVPAAANNMARAIEKLWPQAGVRVMTDAEAALEAAVGYESGVVLIAGTGSIAIGRNAAGNSARVGGYGPWVGDPGSAYEIGRHGVEAAARARDLSGPPTTLGKRIATAMKCGAWEEVIERISAGPDTVFPQLFPVMVQAAEENDEMARAIFSRAALDLSKLAITVVGLLGIKDEEFTLARAGGVFNRFQMLDRRVDALIAKVCPKARIGLLSVPPALAAARLAIRLTPSERASRG